MLEKRTYPRIPVHIHMKISDIYKEDKKSDCLSNLQSPIEVVDISRAGLAFITECVFPVGYYLDAVIAPEIKDFHEILTVMKIVHCKVIDADHYLYGCEFSTQPKELDKIIDQLT